MVADGDGADEVIDCPWIFPIVSEGGNGAGRRRCEAGEEFEGEEGWVRRVAVATVKW